MNRLARMVVVTLALLCAFTIGAGAAIARLLPPRLALFQMPQVAGARLAATGHGLQGAVGPAAGSGGQATASAVSARLSPLIGSGGLGSSVGALVTDLSTGRVLYQLNPAVGFTPASTTKIATAVAAIDVLGPGARFTTSVTMSPAAGAGAAHGGVPTIVLVGGGDPVLAAGPYPAGDYPQPATLTSLAARAAAALRAKGISQVRLRYDDSLFGGPVLGPGWPAFGTATNYVYTGNFTQITGLEVDQGRLTASGRPEDSDDPFNYRPRSLTPSADAAKAFARFLRKDGIAVHGTLAGPPRHAGPVIASVRSPALAEIVQQMLTESNNVIAETLARHVAIATGRPGTFSGAAAAVMAVDRKLGVTGIQLYDGSGLSPLNRISPRALVGLVRLAAGSGPARLRTVITGMPVSGFSGTLAPGSYFGPFGQAGLGTVRAKTGNLTGVVTMAGIVYTASGQALAFAFMGNNIAVKQAGTAGITLAQLATALAGCGCH
ncbi:MAG TPA: D-alanyl-D-alanine carboxypeptidase/D-alanyl-D-alanine-endopeptidase [Streptosporangiaceae bacterium]